MVFVLYNKGGNHPEQGLGTGMGKPGSGHVGLDSKLCHVTDHGALGFTAPPGSPSAKWESISILLGPLRQWNEIYQ